MTEAPEENPESEQEGVSETEVKECSSKAIRQSIDRIMFNIYDARSRIGSYYAEVEQG